RSDSGVIDPGSPTSSRHFRGLAGEAGCDPSHPGAPQVKTGGGWGRRPEGDAPGDEPAAAPATPGPPESRRGVAGVGARRATPPVRSPGRHSSQLGHPGKNAERAFQTRSAPHIYGEGAGARIARKSLVESRTQTTRPRPSARAGGQPDDEVRQ